MKNDPRERYKTKFNFGDEPDPKNYPGWKVQHKSRFGLNVIYLCLKDGENIFLYQY
jgi:hypothetical protein